MPLAWIHDLPKQQLKELATQLGLPKDRTLDDLRRKVKQKWEVIKPYLPSPTAAKSLLVSQLNPLDWGVVPPVPKYLSKLR
jgi:hypothetical protein